VEVDFWAADVRSYITSDTRRTADAILGAEQAARIVIEADTEIKGLSSKLDLGIDPQAPFGTIGYSPVWVESGITGVRSMVERSLRIRVVTARNGRTAGQRPGELRLPSKAAG